MKERKSRNENNNITRYSNWLMQFSLFLFATNTSLDSMYQSPHKVEEEALENRMTEKRLRTEARVDVIICPHYEIQTTVEFLNPFSVFSPLVGRSSLYLQSRAGSKHLIQICIKLYLLPLFWKDSRTVSLYAINFWLWKIGVSLISALRYLHKNIFISMCFR